MNKDNLLKIVISFCVVVLQVVNVLNVGKQHHQSLTMFAKHPIKTAAAIANEVKDVTRIVRLNAIVAKILAK